MKTFIYNIDLFIYFFCPYGTAQSPEPKPLVPNSSLTRICIYSNFTMLYFLINFCGVWNPLEAISLFTKHPGAPVGEVENESEVILIHPIADLWLLDNIC